MASYNNGFHDCYGKVSDELIPQSFPMESEMMNWSLSYLYSIEIFQIYYMTTFFVDKGSP